MYIGICTIVASICFCRNLILEMTRALALLELILERCLYSIHSISIKIDIKYLIVWEINMSVIVWSTRKVFIKIIVKEFCLFRRFITERIVWMHSFRQSTRLRVWLNMGPEFFSYEPRIIFIIKVIRFYGNGRNISIDEREKSVFKG